MTRSSPSPAKRLTYAALLFAALFVTKTHVLPSRSSISSVSTVLGSRPSSPRQSTPSQSKRKASWSARKDSACADVRITSNGGAAAATKLQPSVAAATTSCAATDDILMAVRGAADMTLRQSETSIMPFTYVASPWSWSWSRARGRAKAHLLARRRVKKNSGHCRREGGALPADNT